MHISKRGRLIAATSVAALLMALWAIPAGATPADDGEHQVTICHVTESAGNPYVLITVDVAAFDGEGNNDHTHHVAKDGRIDRPATDFPGGVCPSSLATTTTMDPTTTTIGT
jgi:ABC-type sugar transport system substrate-binding protein